MKDSPFLLFGFEHVASVGVVVFLIGAAILKLHRYDPYRLQKRFHVWLAAVILLRAAGSEIPNIVRNDFTLATDLPFHLCGISQYLVVLYLLRPRKKLFDVLFYWIVGGSTLALIFPELTARFPSTDFFLYFSSHGLPLFAMLYLTFVQGMKPSQGSSQTSFLMLNFYALLIVLPVDILTGGNYLYLFHVPSVQFQPIELLPSWPWYILVLEVFFFGWFRLLYSPFLHFSRAKNAEKLA